MGLSWSGRIEFADSSSAEIQPFIEHPRPRRMGQLKGLDQKPETFHDGTGAEAAQIHRRTVPVEIVVSGKQRLADLVQSSAQIGPVETIHDRLFPIRDLDCPATIKMRTLRQSR